jgi:hypothetical protein
LPVMKGDDRRGGGYDNLGSCYWYQAPLVTKLGPEKRSGCCVHKPCHVFGANRA